MYSYIKAVHLEDVARIREGFDKLNAERGGDMLLAQAEHKEPGIVYLIWLSGAKPAVLASYHQFKEVSDEGTLPKKASLLAGNQATFDAYFSS